jgi:Ni/Co efflux regulator RcnB
MVFFSRVGDAFATNLGDKNMICECFVAKVLAAAFGAAAGAAAVSGSNEEEEDSSPSSDRDDDDDRRWCPSTGAYRRGRGGKDMSEMGS